MPGDSNSSCAGVQTPTTSSNPGTRAQQNQPLREKHTVHWFRKGLRLHDNPALLSGITGAVTFRCVFVIDPWFAGSSNVGINKWRFLLQCLEDLDRNLRKLNSRLFVIRGQPADALPKLFKDWGTTCLTFEEDPEPFGRVRDKNISEMCKELSIEVIQKVSHTLYKLENFCSIIEKNSSRAPLTYHQFQAIIATIDPPAPAETTVTQDTIGKAYTPISEDHDDKYGVPTLEELGFDVDILKPPVWVGGETEALARLERHLERKAWVASFGRPKMTPQSLLASQTGLSPYLRFGCLSTRLFYHQLTDLYKNIKRAYPPLSLHGQLLWREFFYCAATKNPNFDKMTGNPICVQIPWDKNAEALAKWANGQTGFPWIDAIMTQLREEGWIHHLARHAVACFLTRGDLWISWEEGMKVFEELLLDADWSVNAGMWMWLSCSSFFQQFFHCYCPVRFGRKADPNGDYIRRYLPVLKNFPTKYIHEPWNAPESVQRAAKCIIGKEYPLPMVNHAVASRTNMERMKQVYQQLAKYRGTSGGEDVKMACELGTKAQNLPEGIPTHLIQNIEGSYLARSKHIHASLQQMAQQNAPQDPYNSQYTMQMIPQHETSQQNAGNYEKVPMEDVETYVNQEECSRQQNSQYTRIILHRNIAYSVNDPMTPPSNEVLSYANDQNHEFQQISRFPENYQTLNYDEAMVQKMKQEESERREYEVQNSFRMNEEKTGDIFLLATHQVTNQDISNNPNICEENREN
ncbi:cryptochrome-1 isoform X2 [Phlebotomus papatasi]|uniref:cryptochrome-1 isoform X2 n=1 Tax=Phlebotomus papatasi TaxID=29031 RepID=UPI00248395C3|nr:cryptochrome-1 isoform X2 [Phlebotomus papatasi]